jgi:hypothetical protein
MQRQTKACAARDGDKGRMSKQVAMVRRIGALARAFRGGAHAVSPTPKRRRADADDGAAVMRTFSCLVFEDLSSTPSLSFILAGDEERAIHLARRRLLQAEAVAVEIREGGRLLWIEAAAGAEIG